MIRPLLVCLLYVLITFPANAQDEPSKPQRARLPDASALPSDIFFQDAFSQGLVGARPSTLGQLANTSVPNGSIPASPTPTTNQFEWSSVVSARTLEDEVKSLQIELQKTITTPSKFSGGGYLEARRMFTELATLFAVIDEYDRDVRWTKDAATARQLFARAAANTKTTSIQAFNESKKRKMDLEELVRGGSLAHVKASAENTWALVNRAALMQRFTQSYEDGLAVWTANDADFRKQTANIKREAELLMMLSVALTQEGMADGEDEDYIAYSDELTKAARQVLNAVQDGDGDAGRKAASDIGQSCTACHDDYRG